MKITIKKLYQKVKEGDVWYGIVCYKKIPHSQYYHGGGTGSGGVITLSYKYILRIDLWFLYLNFEWLESIK